MAVPRTSAGWPGIQPGSAAPGAAGPVSTNIGAEPRHPGGASPGLQADRGCLGARFRAFWTAGGRLCDGPADLSCGKGRALGNPRAFRSRWPDQSRRETGQATRWRGQSRRETGQATWWRDQSRRKTGPATWWRDNSRRDTAQATGWRGNSRRDTAQATWWRDNSRRDYAQATWRPVNGRHEIDQATPRNVDSRLGPRGDRSTRHPGGTRGPRNPCSGPRQDLDRVSSRLKWARERLDRVSNRP